MNTVFKILVVLQFVLGAALAQAADKLVVNAVEFGIAKFHRYDNKVHAYEDGNAWKVFILPDNADTTKVLVQKNYDNSYTIFYSTLEEMLSAAADISNKENLPISVINVNGHGLPGGMWFPATAQDLNSSDCEDWVKAANGKDEDNYDQYYSAVSKEDIMQLRAYANYPMFTVSCITGLPEWKAAVNKNTAFKAALASDLQVNFLSCLVGLGNAGKSFTEGIGALLLSGANGRVETSTNFGLGDWSMPEGMGFWDYINDAQLDHDNSIYPVNRRDRDMMQKGVVRVATNNSAGEKSTLVADQNFMSLKFVSQLTGVVIPEPAYVGTLDFSSVKSIRIPGTNVNASVIVK
jgi:hypothetical protein